MPLPVISIAQMREWEKATWTAGQTEAEVIHRVGKIVAHCALRLTQPGDFAAFPPRRSVAAHNGS